jgi:hypothetical protein
MRDRPFLYLAIALTFIVGSLMWCQLLSRSCTTGAGTCMSNVLLRQL